MSDSVTLPDWPGFDPAVQAALLAACADGSWGRYHGCHVEALETQLARLHGVAHVLTCASGTLAVETALAALKVGPGCEVILGAYDYPGNFLAVHALGAVPVLVDVSPHNATLDTEAVESAIGPATRAIIASHLHGGLAAMRELRALADARGIGLIEDAAQAAGAAVQGRPVGSWGDFGILSFGGSKLLTAGRGGAILSQRADLVQRARLHLRRGPQQWAALSELQAIVLRPQLDALPQRTALRHEAVLQLSRSLSVIPGLRLFDNGSLEGTPAYYKVGWRFDAQAFGLSRSAFVKANREQGVAFDGGFAALHVGRSATRFRATGSLAAATQLGQDTVILHHPVLLAGHDAIARVARVVERVYRNAAHWLPE